MNRLTRLLVLFCGSLLGIMLVTVAPLALRRVDALRVRRVEVMGTRYLPPHAALQASGIARGANLFDDARPWRTALENHPLIAHARIERVLPATIRLVIEEAEPVALVAQPRAGALAAVNAAGELLPIDLTRADLDLPLIAIPAAAAAARQGTIAAAGLPVLQVLEAMRRAEPALFGWTSDAEPVRGGIRIRLRSPAGAEALLPAAPDALQLRKLRLALADLDVRQDLGRLLRIDARYPDHIVVALTSTAAD
jgi:cell division protein FtsQ